MNKIFKVIWSKTKNCYVVVSELAKRHTKSSVSTIFGKTLVAGVLTSLLHCNFVSQTYAAIVWSGGLDIDGVGAVVEQIGWDANTGRLYIGANAWNSGNPNPNQSGQTAYVTIGNINGSGSGSDPNAIYSLLANGNTITYTKGNGTTGSITTALTNLNGSGTRYGYVGTSALGDYGNFSSGNGFSAFDIAGVEITDGFITGLSLRDTHDTNVDLNGSVGPTKMYKLAATGIGGSGGAEYTAGNGINISSDNKIYV